MSGPFCNGQIRFSVFSALVSLSSAPRAVGSWPSMHCSSIGLCFAVCCAMCYRRLFSAKAMSLGDSSYSMSIFHFLSTLCPPRGVPRTWPCSSEGCVSSQQLPGVGEKGELLSKDILQPVELGGERSRLHLNEQLARVLRCLNHREQKCFQASMSPVCAFSFCLKLLREGKDQMGIVVMYLYSLFFPCCQRHFSCW